MRRGGRRHACTTRRFPSDDQGMGIGELFPEEYRRVVVK